MISNVFLDGMNNGRKQFLEFFITFLYQPLENKVFKEFRPSHSFIRYLQGIDIWNSVIFTKNGYLRKEIY